MFPHAVRRWCTLEPSHLPVKHWRHTIYSEDLPLTGVGITILGYEVGVPTLALLALLVVILGLVALRLATRKQRAA